MSKRCWQASCPPGKGRGSEAGAAGEYRGPKHEFRIRPASAELSVEIGGERQMLEFTGGLVWRTNSANRSLVAARYPGPGVNVSGAECCGFGEHAPSEKAR